MLRYRVLIGFAALLTVGSSASRSPAAFHLWTLVEFYSNSDGSVQFIEMLSSGPSETVATGAQIRTTSGSNVFSFPGNLSGSTLNKRLLIATPGFGSLPGAVTPDFTLPTDNFFDVTGDTVRLFSPIFGEFHSRAISSVPTDGILSLNYPGATSAANSPTNFAGASGSVDLSATDMLLGDYNENDVIDAADYTTWRDALTAGSTTLANDPTPGAVDESDFTYWRDHFGETLGAGAGEAASAAVPEPTTAMLLLAACLELLIVKRMRTIRR